MGKDTYSMTLSQVEEESNENVQIEDFLVGRKTMVVEYQSNKSTRWFEIPSRMLTALQYKRQNNNVQ